ncbi:hypothetical protein FRX31_008394, partial [Thalictrum thalictroides]
MAEGLRMAISMGMKRIRVDLNSKQAVESIEEQIEPSMYSEGRSVHEQRARQLKESFEIIIVRHIYSRANQCAYYFPGLSCTSFEGLMQTEWQLIAAGMSL